MSVGLFTTLVCTHVGFVGRMDEHVLLAIGRVGKATVTAGEITLEGLLSCNIQHTGIRNISSLSYTLKRN